MTTAADLVLVGGNVVTMDPGAAPASAVAGAGGRIVAVGDDVEVAGWRGPGTEVVDLRGATVVPGLVDGHIHPVMGIDFTAGVDLSAVGDLDGLRAALAGAAASGDDEWVLGWGLDPNVFAGAPVTNAVLDEVVGSRPAYLVAFDGHAALASSEALARAGITGPRRFASTAEVVCDPSGRPTGHLLEEGACAPVSRLVPAQPLADRVGRLRRTLEAMAATGLTGGHVMDADPDALELLTALDADGGLPLRLRLAPWCRPDDDAARRDELLALQGRGGALWAVAAVKFFMDGTIDGGTAWLHEPDCHGASTRPYWQDPGDFTATLRRFAAAGVATATHAIGDAAVAHVLDALDGHAGGAVPHRIEHIETLPTDQVARFARLGVVASMQPTHVDYTRADHSDNWSTRLGDERADRAWRCRDIADSGATLVLGSDWPIAPYDPRLTLAAAQLRRPARRPEVAAVRPGQALSALQALAGYTTAPAVAAGEADRAGRVAPGRRADLTVLGADPQRMPAADVADVAVLATVVDGVVRHRSADLG
jgi:predicted amidohydrolase YtcJ